MGKNDEVLLEHTKSGDVLFMNRKCYAMKDPVGMGLCFLTKTENRFDHVGMVLKIEPEELPRYPAAQRHIVDTSPSGTYVLETNIRGITLRSAEARLSRTSANEVVSRSVVLDSASSGTRSIEATFLEQMEQLYDTPYEANILAILPSLFSTPDKMDRIDAAHKINCLRLEAAALEKMAQQDITKAATYRKLVVKYAEAQLFMLQTYFPHLRRVDADDPLQVEWSSGHFWVDGVNDKPKMVCSELICNLWRRCGIINGFVPASSMRPFDLLDGDRFNFLSPSCHFGHLNPVVVAKSHRGYWTNDADSAAASDPKGGVALRGGPSPAATLTEDARLSFINAMRKSCLLPSVRSVEEVAAVAEVVPIRWVVQSSSRYDVLPNLWCRVGASVLLFGALAVPCAPLTLRWIEGQMGLFLLRGSVWSLASGVFARDAAFAAVQAMLIAAGAHCYRSSGSEAVMGTATWSTMVDTRHPYYGMAALYFGSAAIAHFATMPIRNANLAFHFGPVRPGPLSMRQLMHGGIALAPLTLLLPLQAFWLSWFETAGSAVIPTRSSVWRPREDLLSRPDWPHFRMDALLGAFAATLGIDAMLYPCYTAASRSFVSCLYQPQKSPSFRRSLFAGYRYRFLSNILIFTGSTAALHGFGCV